MKDLWKDENFSIGAVYGATAMCLTVIAAYFIGVGSQAIKDLRSTKHKKNEG